MRELLGKAKTVRELLKGVKYSIDYYQHEYKWHEKQVHELVNDFSDKFLEEYDPTHPRQKVADYPSAFLRRRRRRQRCSHKLVHRLSYTGAIVAFKMGRRQGARRAHI
jgi:hypothetical protein